MIFYFYYTFYLYKIIFLDVHLFKHTHMYNYMPLCNQESYLRRNVPNINQIVLVSLFLIMNAIRYSLYYFLMKYMSHSGNFSN